MSDEYIAKKALGFVYLNYILRLDSFIDDSPRGDFSPKSFYDSLGRILRKERQVGDCVGITQVVKYLLDSWGIEKGFIQDNTHVALLVKIDENWIPIETTIPNGYNKFTSKKKMNSVDLYLIVAYNVGLSLDLGLDKLRKNAKREEI